MAATIIKTEDRAEALAALERRLDAGELVNARMQKLDGCYTVEFSQPTDSADDASATSPAPD